MNKWIIFLFITIISSLLTINSCETRDLPTVKFQLMSFNIRRGGADQGEHSWEQRRDLVCEVISQRYPDIAGLQEALNYQIEHILENVPGYASIGIGRLEGKSEGEFSNILYRKERFTVTDSGTFWFSETPQEPGSKSWGNEYPRICTWGRFIDKESKHAFYVYNAHLDHKSQESRMRSVELLLDKVDSREHGDEPFVITGDFNVEETNPVMQYMKEHEPMPLVDSYRVIHKEAKDVGTYHGYEGGQEGRRIDYIMAREDMKVIDAKILTDEFDKGYPSDHYPVIALLAIPKK